MTPLALSIIIAVSFVVAKEKEGKCYLKYLISGQQSLYYDECKKAIYSDSDKNILPYLQKCNPELQLFRLQGAFRGGYLSQNETGSYPFPNLIGIGVQKAGTTALFHYLRYHPDIGGVDGKERHYFERCYITSGLFAYRSNFQGIKLDLKYRLEISPEYISLPDASCLMSLVVPNVKLLLIIRDPIERYLSGFRMFHKRNLVHLSFPQLPFHELVDGTIRTAKEENCAFQNFDNEQFDNWYRCFGCKSMLRGNFIDWFNRNADEKYLYNQFLSFGMYLPQIRWFLQFFDKSQLWIIDSQKMNQDTIKVIGETLDWLGLEYSIPNEKLERRIFVNKIIKVNASEVESGLRMLHDFYHPQVIELKKFLVQEYGEKWNSLENWPSYKESFSVNDFLENYE